MVARPGQYQASLNSGELAPDVWGRSDIKQFYSAASLMLNAEPVPQGGFDALPGTREAGFVRGALAEHAYAGVANYGPHVAGAVLYTATFASAAIDAVDLIGFASSVATTGILQLESSPDGAVWTAFGAAFNARAIARTRRIALPPGQGRTCTRIRLRLTAAPGGSLTFSLDDLKLQKETAIGTTGRIFDHTYAVESAFTVVLTPFNVDVWKGDVFVAAMNLNLSALQLPGVTREQRFDTMLLFHPDLPTQRIMRRDSDTDWSSDVAPFANIPNVDYGEVYGNIVNDQWKITIQWSAGPMTAQLEMQINGEDTASVTIFDNGLGAPDWPRFANDVRLAVEALPSVANGVIVTYDAPGGVQYATVTIEFAGAGNAGSQFSVAPRIVNVTFAAANASHIVFGDPGGEPIASPTRGYPVTGNFYQDRLYLGGFRSEPSALLGSVTGEYFDLNTRIESASGGLLFRLDVDGAERVQFLVRSRHLVIFTNEAEYYVTDRAIARGTVPNVARSSRNGIAPGIRPVEGEDGLIYVGRSRSIIYAAVYSDVSQKYESEPISLLASHLARILKSAAIQRASASTDAARYLVVRDDGLMVIGVMIRNQDVTAFVRFVTDGFVRDVAVDGANEAYLLVQRQIGGAPRLVRERMSPDADMHQERVFAFEADVGTVTGLASHEGATVWANCDGYYEGPLTVTGGAVSLPYPARNIVIGRWTPPDVRTLPVPRLVGERTVLQRPARVHTVRLHLSGATSVAIGANDRPARDVALLRGGDLGDVPVMPFTGDVKATGLMGWTEDGIVSITQVRPGKFRVRNITVEARV
jgi:hypothetical protein